MTATAENITIGISALSLLGIFIKSFFKREEKKDTEENSQSKMLIEAMTTQLKGLVETVANQKNSEIKELAEVVKLSVNKQDKITETIQELVKAMAVKSEREGSLEKVLERLTDEMSRQSKIMVLLEERSRGGEIDRKD